MKCLYCGRFKAQERCQLCNPAASSSEDDDDSFGISSLAPNNSLEVKFPDVNCCYGCKRQSTEKYPVDLNLVSGTNLIARKFGPTTTSQNVLLCFFAVLISIVFPLTINTTLVLNMPGQRYSCSCYLTRTCKSIFGNIYHLKCDAVGYIDLPCVIQPLNNVWI